MLPGSPEALDLFPPMRGGQLAISQPGALQTSILPKVGAVLDRERQEEGSSPLSSFVVISEVVPLLYLTV